MCAVAGVAAQAQPPSAPAPQAFNPQDLIPLDPAVLTGTLPNGLRYFIRRNGRPANRISLRLVVKSGSLEETDDEQGLAHFIEHVAFDGSAHFKPGEIVSYFESVGVRLGPHVNAYTNFDETVFMLELPTDRPEVLAKGLAALSDFAGGTTFDPAQVDKERGVVIEEWRGGLGASSRVRDKQLPVLLHDSRYAERLPIGKADIIRTASAERLRHFYDTWYRPDRMAVIAVGDIDPAPLQAAIAGAFSPLSARAPAAPIPDHAIPLRHPLLASVASDPEVTRSSVQIGRKRPREIERRVEDYRRDLVERLVERMFNERLAELARRSDAKFLGAQARDRPLNADVALFEVGASVEDGRIEEGLAALTLEVKRVRELGFTATELDRAKKSLAAFYERAFAERDKTESGSFAEEYVDYVLTADPSPGIEDQDRLAQQALPSISPNDVREAAARLLADGARVVLAVSPAKDGVRIPTEAALVAASDSAERTPVTAWSDTASTRELVEKKPAPAAITSRRVLAGVDVTVVRFANGVEAWLKPTDFKNDQVLFSLDALGGSSIAPPADFAEASLAADYVRLSGAGGLKALEIEKLLAGSLASASPFVSLSTHGISGSAPPAELETALQLLYQEFTAPGDNPEAFALLKRRLEAAVANRGTAPMDVFAERVDDVNTSHHYTAQPLTRERVAALDREKTRAFYGRQFSKASDFTFFMVGAFALDPAIDLLSRYVGSLPASGEPRSDFHDVGIRFPDGIERVLVRKGREPRSHALLSFFADPPPDPVEQERIRAATTILQIALRDVLREDLGQTYNVSVALDQALPQRGGGHIEISFGAAPENIEAMSDRVLEEIQRLRQNGPSADLMNRAKESARRDYETALRQNAYWLGRLVSIHLLGGNPQDILDRAGRIEALTPAVLQDTFRRYFPSTRFTVVTLVPEASAP